MEDCLPSEVARLVLGYLQEVNCMKSWKTFLVESPSLQEYYLLYNSGKVYNTNVDEKSLLEILSLYRSLRKYNEIIEEIKRWENEYNFNPDMKKDILEEIANMIGVTFQKYLPYGSTMDISTSNMITFVVPYQPKANISDDLHENIEQSDNIETNASNVASENTDGAVKLPNICEVYSLSDVTDFNIPKTETKETSLETAFLINSTKDKYLEISNTEMGDSNVKDTSSAGYRNSQTYYIASEDLFVRNNESINAETGDGNVKDTSAMNKDSQTYYIASKDLFLCNNRLVNNDVIEMYGNNWLIVPESPTNVEAENFSATTDISQTILENADKSAAPVLSNSHNMKKINQVMTDLNNENHTIKNLELIEGSSNNFPQNSLSPNEQVDSDNNIDLNSISPPNKQNIVGDVCNFENQQNIVNEVPNFENKLVCLNNGIGSTLAPNSNQFTAVNTLQVPTIPTYILAGNVLMPNTAPYTYVINPFSQMSLPIPSISSNDIQNPDSTTIYTLKSDGNVRTLPTLFPKIVSASSEGQPDKSSTSGMEVCEHNNNSSVKTSKRRRLKCEAKYVKISKAKCSRKMKTNELESSASDKRRYSTRLSKVKSLCLFPSIHEKEENKQKIQEVTMDTTCVTRDCDATIRSNSEVSALQLLSLITGQNEDFNSPIPGIENKIKDQIRQNESQPMSVLNGNIDNRNEAGENLIQSCKTGNLNESFVLQSDNKLNSSSKPMNINLNVVKNNIISGNDEINYHITEENESMKSYQLHQVDTKILNSSHNVEPEENTMVQFYDKSNKVYEQTETLQNCKEMNNLEELANKKNDVQSSLLAGCEGLKHHKNDVFLQKRGFKELKQNVKKSKYETYLSHVSNKYLNNIKTYSRLKLSKSFRNSNIVEEKKDKKLPNCDLSPSFSLLPHGDCPSKSLLYNAENNCCLQESGISFNLLSNDRESTRLDTLVDSTKHLLESESTTNNYNLDIFSSSKIEDLSLKQYSSLLNSNKGESTFKKSSPTANIGKETHLENDRPLMINTENSFPDATSINIKSAKKNKPPKSRKTETDNNESSSICKSVPSFSSLSTNGCLENSTHPFNLSELVKSLPVHNSIEKNSISNSNQNIIHNDAVRKRKLENSCEVSDRLECNSKFDQFSNCCTSSQAAKKQSSDKLVSLSSESVCTKLPKDNIKKKSGVKKKNNRSNKQTFHSSSFSENGNGKNIVCSNTDSKLQSVPYVLLTKLDEHEIHCLTHKLYYNKVDKQADCRNNSDQSKTVSEENIDKQADCRNNSDQTSKTVSEENIDKQADCRNNSEQAGKKVSEGNIDKQADCRNNSEQASKTVSEGNVDKQADCRKNSAQANKTVSEGNVDKQADSGNNSEQASKTVSEGNVDKQADSRNNSETASKTLSEGNITLSQSANESILSYSLKLSIHNFTNTCDSNFKDTVETKMETSVEKGNEISIAFASCEEKLVISQSSTNSHSPNNVCANDTIISTEKESSKNPTVSPDKEINKSIETSSQWAIIQSAIEKYGYDYILSKVDEYLNC